DLPVAVGHELDVVEAVEELGEALRREEDGELVGLVRLVGGDEAAAEPADRDAVLGSQERQAVALDLEQRVQPVELQLAELELVLQRHEARGDVPDLLLETADAAGDLLDLLRECVLLL